MHRSIAVSQYDIDGIYSKHAKICAAYRVKMGLDNKPVNNKPIVYIGEDDVRMYGMQYAWSMHLAIENSDVIDMYDVDQLNTIPTYIRRNTK